MTVVPKLPLAEFDFIYQAQKPINPVIVTASLWHGIFGNALRARVCIAPEAECKSCMFLLQCDYPFLFEGVKPLEAEKNAISNNVPVPHIFKIARDLSSDSINSQQIKVSMVLVGKASQHLTAVIKAMDLAGKNGLGKARIPLQLRQVTQQNQFISQSIYTDGSIHSAMPAQSPAIPDMPSAVQIIFNTPYRTGKNNADQFDSAFFLMQIIRRISSLQNIYTAECLDANFENLKVLTGKAEMETAVRPQQDMRYSARHKQSLNTGGFMGKITFSLAGLEALWPYIYLGQWTHVGKNASFGYGNYKVLSIAEKMQ